MQYPGFLHNGQRIFYIDAEGKDISFSRWRVSLYYAVHLAKTYFLPTQAAYDAFLEIHASECYPDYTDFRNDFEGIYYT